MSGKFIFADSKTDYDKLKQQGITGVLIPDSENILETACRAAKCGMKVYISMACDKKDKISAISPDKDGIALFDETIESVSLRAIKKVLERLGVAKDFVSGFIIPVPKINFPIWNLTLSKMCRIRPEESDILYELFSDSPKLSNLRLWYLENAQKYIIKRYMLPKRKLLEGLDKTAVFDIGKAEMQHDFTRKMVNPISLKNAGFSLAFYPLGEAENMGLKNGDFIMHEDYCQQIEDECKTKILLVKPIRGIMQCYNWEEPGDRYVETDSRAIGFESVYYCDTLKRCGYEFDACQEFSFKRAEDFREYKQILICPSCKFLKSELKVIEELKSLGAVVNGEELLAELSQKGEE